MNTIALISGGKDSIYTIHKLKKQGINIVGLLYMRCATTIDSYMYQSVGEELIQSVAIALDLPLYISETSNLSLNTKKTYIPTENDEVEDLYKTVKNLKSKIQFEALCSGAILSEYQKNRIESVCERLNLISLTPLWQYDQSKLLKEMIAEKIDAIIVKTGTPELKKSDVGKNIKDLNVKLDNVCGEGGEYETIVLNCPLYKKIIHIEESEIKPHPEDEGRIERTFFLKVLKHKLIDKN